MYPEFSELLVAAKFGHTFQEVYQGNIQAMEKAGNAPAIQTHAHTRLCDTLRKRSGHARDADGAAGTHCCCTDGWKSEAFDARRRGVVNN